METFRNLIGKDAKAKFAVTVLYEMVTNDVAKINAIFDEGKSGNVLETSILEDLLKKAKEILPVKLVYDKGEEKEMQKFIEYRDEMLKACGC